MNNPSQFSQSIRVQETDCDLNGRLLPSALLRYAQLIASAHCQSLGITAETYRRSHSAFLLARVSLEITGDMAVGDSLEILTTAGKMTRAIFPRYTSFRRGGEELASVDAAWILVDPENRKIYRHLPPELPLDFQETPPSHSGAIPKEKEPQPLCCWTVPYSRCDQNGHLNNCHYADWACDALPLEVIGRQPVKKLLLSYHKELLLGQPVQLYRKERPEGWYVCGKLDDSDPKPAFEALVSF